MRRRDLLAVSAGLMAAPGLALAQTQALTPAQPITPAERRQRIARAQGLMRRAGLSALLIEPGASLVYFLGLRWGRSERLTGGLIPAEGEPLVVTPSFEAPSVRERLAIPVEIRTWEEHEDPARVVAAALAERRLKGSVGVEETVRWFVADGLRRQGVEVRDDAGVVRACRVIKSPAEIALMQRATDITIAAYRETLAALKPGMTAEEVASRMNGATRRLGGEPQFALVLIGEASAYPHGGGKPQAVQDGVVVLMDCGCAVEGYQSDVSRTFILGSPTARQREVWGHVKAGQARGFAAARVGVPAGQVDDAVRAYYRTLGYGPDYRLPGLSHRTGHGIGLDGHEPVNLVRGEAARLAPGMCFSVEPGLYFPGQFGVRLEDCAYMTEAGPRWFSEPQPSWDRV